MKEPQNNNYFPLSEYEDRITRLRTEMKLADIDAILLSTEPNVVYFTGLLDGYWIATMHDDSQLVLITAHSEDEPILFIPDSLEQTAWTSCVSDVRVWSQFTSGKSKGSITTVVEGFIERKLKKAKVGLEIGPHDRPGMSLPFLKKLQESLPNVEWVDSTELLKRISMIKSSLEIEKIKIACKITCDAFQIGMDAIKEGMSEKELGQIIAMEMARLCPDVCVNNPWIIFVHSSGRGPCAFDGIPSDYRFKKGDTVYVDGGFIYQMYHADIIRCGIIGKPSREVERYYYASRDANMSALRYVKPGIKCKELYKFWDDTVCKLGFEDSLRSQKEVDWDFLGHGLGSSIHELPLLNSSSEEVLKHGMVFAIEGNIFDRFPFSKTKYALKNEDDVLVTDTGYEWLTPLSNDLWISER